MGRMTTYNPRKVTCALGNHIVTGFADDSFIVIEHAGDGTSYVEGADGEVARTIDPSKVYKVKISLLQNSRTNSFLQKMYDKDSNDGNGYFPVIINDLIGGQKFISSVAWVTKPASFSRGKAQGNREWEITAANGELR